MKKTIWVVHQYASTHESGMGGRHYYLGSELAKQGYEVYVIASASHHLLREKKELQQLFEQETVEEGFHFVWVRMPPYQEAHSKQRALNWFIFAWRMQKLSRFIPHKPDVVLASSPSPISFLGAQRIAKKFKARLAFEVRDIWPLTLCKIGGYSVRHPFIRFLQWVEDKAYRQSDVVISNLRNSVDHMVTRGMNASKFTWVPNGFSLEEVQKEAQLETEVMAQLPVDKFIVGYTGTLGVANAMDTLIAAAEILRDNTKIAFVIVGDGQEKCRLKAYVSEKNLSNITFIDAIPKIQVQAMLGQFDACYIGWLNDELYRFGIGANKIPEYLYSAKPVIHAYSGKFDPIMEAEAGVHVAAEAPEELANAVLHLYGLSPEERDQLGKSGRKKAIEKYEYRILSRTLANALFKG